jgi:hypothetical protein
MSIFKTKDKEGRSIHYGFDAPYAGYFVTVWKDSSTEKEPIIVEDRWTGLNGGKLIEMLEDEFGVFVPECRRRQALEDMPFEDEDSSFEHEDLPF